MVLNMLCCHLNIIEETAMLDQDRYTEIVQQLAVLNYEVLPDGTGYIVRHLTDMDDISEIRDLNDLIELTDLFEWRAQRPWLFLPS